MPTEIAARQQQQEQQASVDQRQEQEVTSDPVHPGVFEISKTNKAYLELMNKCRDQIILQYICENTPSVREVLKKNVNKLAENLWERNPVNSQGKEYNDPSDEKKGYHNLRTRE